MSLNSDSIPDQISPSHLCTPSRFAGERRMVAVLRKIAEEKKIYSVLDIGCGAGEYRFLFPGCQYDGIDVDDSGFAGKTGGDTAFYKGRAEELPAECCRYDLIFSSYAFEYFPEPRRALGEMNRVLRSDGTIMLCLPGHGIKAYEFLPSALRRCGVELGAVSAMPGIHHYSPKELNALAQQAGLVMMSIVPVYGLTTFVCKYATTVYRIIRHIIARRNHGAAAYPLYVGRQVSAARSREEWQRICHAADTSRDSLDRQYARLLKCCAMIDRLLLNKPIIEYIALLHKPRGC